MSSSATSTAAKTDAPKGEFKDLHEEGVNLKKELGLLEAISIIVGSIIGSGIFVSPKGVIEYTGSVGMSLAVWASCGLMSTVGALCFAELGTMIPRSGGMYNYLHEAFGAVPAFMYMWVTAVIVHAVGPAVVGLTFASYLLQADSPECGTVPDVPKRLIAASVICFLSWVNSVNVKWVTKVQNVFTVTKVLALIVIIVRGVYHLARGHLDNYANPLEGTNWAPATISTAFYQCLFSYGGWENLCLVVEELKNPNRNLPLAIVTSTTLVTVIYVLTNVAYLAVLTPAEMLSSSAVAMTFASRSLGVMAWIMPIFVLCSTFGFLNGAVFTQSRLIYAGARRGQFPEAFSIIHATKFTPIPAVLLNGMLCLVMLSTSDVVALINYSTFATTLTQFTCMCALFFLRYKQPHRQRPFKVWLALPVVFSVALVFLLVLPLIRRPIEVGSSLAVIASGLPIYYLTIYRQDLAHKASGPLRKLTHYFQLLFLGLPGEKID